jgi:hypothetical protein
MRDVKRVLAGIGAAALLASGMIVGLGGPASAAPSITVTPNSDLKDGQVVTVTVSGFSPKAPVAIGVCKTGRPLKGAGDCGRTKDGHSQLTEADASGSATAKITIVRGSLANTTPPVEECPPCSMSAANIANAAETATVPLQYGGGETVVTEDPESGGNAPVPEDTPTPGLPDTGPREVAITALLGYALLQLGLIFAIRSNRAAPRRARS